MMSLEKRIDIVKKKEVEIKDEEKKEAPVEKELVVEEKAQCTCKKRQRFGVGFLFGLIVGVLSCVGILAWQGFTKDIEETKKDNDVIEIENKDKEDFSADTNLEKDSEIAKSLMKQLEIYDALPYFYFELGKEEITNQDLLYFALKQIGYKDSFSLAEVEKVISSYFDYSITPEPIACRKSFHLETEYLYTYDATSKKFIANEKHGGHGAGHTMPYGIYNRFVSLKEKKEDTKELEYPVYELVVYRAYSSLAEDTGIGEEAYYSSYEDAYNEKNALFKIEYDDDFEVKTDVLKELDNIDSKKLSKETFTFVKKDNLYLLSKYEAE